MDRLSPLTLLPLALLAACRRGEAPQRPVERVNAVPAAPVRVPKAEDFCDVVARRDDAKSFKYPEIVGAAAAADGRWRWINVWATWCKPCIEEIPLLVQWRADLEKLGTPVDLVLVSADSDDESVERFRKEHPQTPAGPRIKDPDDAEAWLVSLGMDKGATLPVHVFVDPRGGIRCARSGGVGRGDQAVVQRIFAATE